MPNLNQLIIWCDAQVPEASETVIPSISTTKLDKKSILNEGAKEFVKLTRCFPKDKKFNCTSGVNSYSISSNIPDFLELREEGVWHYRSATTTTTWERLKPTTMRTLDQERPTWRDQSNSDLVERYWQDGNILGVYYTPSTTISNGFHAYYYGMSSDMSILDNYPFTGNSSEDPRLTPYENILLDYYQAKALAILGYKDDSSMFLKTFYEKCMVAKSQLQSRRDLAQESRARVKTNMNFGNPFRR